MKEIPKVEHSEKANEAFQRVVETKEEKPIKNKKVMITWLLAVIGIAILTIIILFWYLEPKTQQKEYKTKKELKPAVNKEVEIWSQELLQEKINKRVSPGKANPEAASKVGKFKSQGLPSSGVTMQKRRVLHTKKNLLEAPTEKDLQEAIKNLPTSIKVREPFIIKEKNKLEYKIGQENQPEQRDKKKELINFKDVPIPKSKSLEGIGKGVTSSQE